MVSGSLTRIPFIAGLGTGEAAEIHLSNLFHTVTTTTLQIGLSTSIKDAVMSYPAGNPEESSFPLMCIAQLYYQPKK